jgi:hypothetical protein
MRMLTVFQDESAAEINIYGSGALARRCAVHTKKSKLLAQLALRLRENMRDLHKKAQFAVAKDTVFKNICTATARKT